MSRVPVPQLVDAIYELGARSGVRAVFVLGARGQVVHARGEFKTEVVYPPSAEAMREGWAAVRSDSGDLLVFVALEGEGTLCGVFDALVSDLAALRVLEQVIESGEAPQ